MPTLRETRQAMADSGAAQTPPEQSKKEAAQPTQWVMTPSGRSVPQSWMNKDWIKQTLQDRGYQTVQSPLLPNMREIIPPDKRGYWENPYRVARYYNYIRSMPKEWQAPEWLDTQAVETAYKYMEYRNENKPWQQWKYLPEDDSASPWLKNIVTPPLELMNDDEIKAEQENAAKIGAWEELKPYQQLWESIVSPQPITADDPTGRPTITKVIGNTLRSAMAGAAGKGIATMGTGVLALAFPALAPAILGAGAAIGTVFGATMFLTSMYQTMTGKEMPVLGSLVNMQGKVFSLPSEVVEAGAGLFDQIKSDGFDEVLENLEPAIRAARANYETNERNIFQDLYTKAAVALGAGGAEASDIAGKREVYRWDLGQAKPQALGEDIQTGVAALNDLRDRIEADPQNADEIMAGYIANFGSSGLLNDYLLQNIFDPTNVLPAVTQQWAANKALASGDPNMIASFTKPTAKNWIVEALPTPVNYLIEGIGGKWGWEGSKGVLDGLRKYETFINYGKFASEAEYKAPADFSLKEKLLGQLDPETGLPKYYMPAETSTGTGILSRAKNLWNFITNQTPASKGIMAHANMMDHIARIMVDFADNDPDEAVRLIKAMAKVDPKTTGDVLGQILNPTGSKESLIDPRQFNSPIGSALGVALKDITTLDSKLDEFHQANWIAPLQPRMLMQKLSALMGETPEEIIKRINAPTGNIVQDIQAKAQAQNIRGFESITLDSLREQIKVFTGDEALPLNAKEYNAMLLNMISDGIQDHLIARFGIQKDSNFMRLSHTLKSMQSLVLLGFNPLYFVNNAVNNIITRSAQGLVGFMGSERINNLLTRLEIDPTRPDMGFDKEWSQAREVFGIGEDGKAKKISQIKAGEKDLLTTIDRGLSKVSDKLGIFQKLSGVIERAESRQAFAIALKQISGSVWRVGVGLRKLPAQVEAALGPEITKKLYQAAEESYNFDELTKALYAEKVGKTINESLNKVAENLAKREGATINDPLIYREMLSSMGIDDELNTKLANAKNIQDIDTAFDEVQVSLEQKVRELYAEELQTRADHIKVKVQAEGITAAIAELTDVETEFQHEWILHFNEIQELYAKKPYMTSASFNHAWKMQQAKDDMRFTDLFDWEKATTEGVLEAMGFKKDIPEVSTIVNSQEAVKGNWRDFYKARTKAYEDLNSKNYANNDEYNQAWKDTEQKVADLADAAHEFEQNEWAKINESYIALSKDKELARAWRNEVTKIRQDMIAGLKDFYTSLRNNPPRDIFERNARWNQFLDRTYKPRIMQLKSKEALIQNLNNEFYKPPSYWNDYVMNNPVDEKLPPVLLAKIKAEAGMMLKELDMGSAGRRVLVYQQNEVGGSDVSHMIAEPTTNVSWYRTLAEQGMDRSRVANALAYLQEGKTNSNAATQSLKRLILDRLTGKEPRGYDGGYLKNQEIKLKETGNRQYAWNEEDNQWIEPDMEASWVLGEKDMVASELNDIILGGDAPEDFIKDQGVLGEVMDYWENQWVHRNAMAEMFKAANVYEGEHVDALMAVMDWRAQKWAMETGNPPSEWWKKTIADVRAEYGKDVKLNELDQATINNIANKLYQAADPDTWYYSGLQRVIEGMPNKMPADQLMNWLNGKVKKEEMADTGFDGWLKEQQGMVQKQDALDYLATNKIVLQEVVKGKNNFRFNDVNDYTNEISRLESAGLFDEAEQLNLEMEEWAGRPPTPDGTKWAQYRIPGENTNYRNVLLTLPFKEPAMPEGYYIREMDYGNGKIGYFAETPTTRSQVFWTRGEAEADLQNSVEGLKDFRASLDAFQSSHWSEPNVLVHLRFDDRIDTAGKKVLMVEEIQSDWHEKGRDQGYKTPGFKIGEEIRYRGGMTWNNAWIMEVRENGDLVVSRTPEGLSQSIIDPKRPELEVTSLDKDKAVPNAPMKKSWESLGMKRIIRYAVENGYDKVAWTTGAQQSEMYSRGLQSVADTIEYNHATNTMTAIKNGEAVKSEVVKPNDLKNYVGKDVAEKLLDVENHAIRDDINVTRVTGDEIKVGSKGMVEAYDIRHVNNTNDFLKKFGQKVEDVDLGGKTSENDGQWVIYDQGGQPFEEGTTFNSRDEAVEYIKGYERELVQDSYSVSQRDDGYWVVDNDPDNLKFATEDGAENYKNDIIENNLNTDQYQIELINSNAGIVHGFTITPEMRDSVMKGLPLYQVDNDIFNLAKKYGIPTASKDGAPLDKNILAIVNKYGDQKFDKLEDVKPADALLAFEKRRREKGEPPVQDALYKGAVSFDKDGAAIWRAFAASDVSTLVHEIGHVFRRQIAGDDLEAIARWGGLTDAAEYARLQDQFDNGTISKKDRKRYVEAEEKFAEGFEKYVRAEHKTLPKYMQVVFAKFAQWLMSVFNSAKKTHNVDIMAVIKVGDKEIRIKDVMDRMFIDMQGRDTIGSVPEPFYQGKALSELAQDNINPLMMALKEQYKYDWQNYTPFKAGDIPIEQQAAVKKWTNELRGDMSSSKLAMQKYAEGQRDLALLNYKKRTGMDEVLGVLYPYQFWYTKSMMNWAVRMLERPDLFAMYTRWKEMQKRMEKQGIPTRLKGKIRVPAPYLPDWMGGGVWIDPSKQLFPFAQFGDPYDVMANKENSARYAAYKILDQMVEEGNISDLEAQNAKANRSGKVWEEAYAQAVQESDMNSPITMASMMLQPASYITTPYNIITGQPEKNMPTPLLKTTQAVESALQGTAFETIGKGVGLLGKPEQALRETMMTKGKAMFGEFGDYYIDRQLANMVADGEISLARAKAGMLDHTGADYDAAVKRVMQELSLKSPGILPVLSLKGGGSPGDVLSSVFLTLFPAGLLPQGELEYLGLKDEYNAAWEQYKLGNNKALSEFFDKYPEFEARSALRVEPENRLQEFLISDIWDKYMTLDKINQTAVRSQLGQQFQDSFLSKTTRDYESVPIETLALWAHTLGGYVPKEYQPQNAQALDLWGGDVASGYSQFQAKRDRLFPNYSALQTEYYALPKAKRSAFLNKFPELAEYWDWKRAYEQAHPELAGAFASQRSEGISQNQISQMPSELTQQLMAYAIAGQNLGPGAWTALRDMWERSGKPYGDLKEWVEEAVAPAFQ